MPQFRNPSGLSYYQPKSAHKHTVLHVPESHTLLVGPNSCMRRHAIHAQQYGDARDVSFLAISEADVISGDYETLVIDAVADLLSLLSMRPRIIILGVFCIDDFLGTDAEALVGLLTGRFPDIVFAVDHIDPVTLGEDPSRGTMKKSLSLYRFLRPEEEHDRGITMLGSFVSLPESCELLRYFSEWGVGPVRELFNCKTYDDYQALAKSCLALGQRTSQPQTLKIMEKLGIPYYHLPVSYSTAFVARGYRDLAQLLGVEGFDERIAADERRCREHACRVARGLAGMPVAIDSSALMSPFSAAKALLGYGFNVTHVLHRDSVLAGEDTVQQEIEALGTVRCLRKDTYKNQLVAESEGFEGVAIGEDTARILGADCVVDIWHDEGGYGFQGITRLVDAIQEAAENTVLPLAGVTLWPEQTATPCKSATPDDPLSRGKTTRDSSPLQGEPQDQTPVLPLTGGAVGANAPTEGVPQAAVACRSTSPVSTALSACLPPFASDYTGVASALYNLNCLTAINDAACCTQHFVHCDEPRYERLRRPVLCTQLRSTDAVFGNDARVVDAVVNAVAATPVELVALVGTPVPAIAGMDTIGIACEIEAACGIPALGFATTGFKYYDHGLYMAGKALIERFAEDGPEVEPGRVNVLGMSPLDYGDVGNEQALCQAAAPNLFMDYTLGDVRHIGAAELNIAASAAGLRLAKLLHRRFGTPYTSELPLGPAFMRLLAEQAEGSVLIIGDQVIAHNMRRALESEPGHVSAVAVASFFGWDGSLARPGDAHLKTERALSDYIRERDFDTIVCDPLIAQLPEIARRHVVPLVHPAISGRLHWADAPRYFE